MDDGAFKSLINQKISYFNSGDNPVPLEEVTILKALEDIRDGRWRTEIEWYRQETDIAERESIKLKFPAFTFSGTFSYRKVSELKNYTHVLVIDVDKKHMTKSYESTRKEIISCPFVFAAFQSPSGGVKALAYSRMKLEYHKERLFPCVEEYFMRELGIRIDTSGKDISRLCFISMDPDIYISWKDKEPFDPSKFTPEMYESLKRSFIEVNSIDYSKYSESRNIKYIFEKAREWASRSTGGFKIGSRNNYIYYLSCILNRSGVPENITLDIILSRYQSMNKDEAKKSVHSAYFHHKNEFGIKPILEYKNKNQNQLL